MKNNHIMKNKKNSKNLSLNKLTISKLTNPDSILGGIGLGGPTEMTGMGPSCQPTGCPEPSQLCTMEC